MKNKVLRVSVLIFLSLPSLAISSAVVAHDKKDDKETASNSSSNSSSSAWKRPECNPSRFGLIYTDWAQAPSPLVSLYTCTQTGWRPYAGMQGPTGPVGPQGPAGPQGVAGPVGPQGPKGEKGDAGALGPVGPMGPQGPTGLPGMKGDKGDRGEVGPQGPMGIAGPIGPIGPQGIAGPVGPVGPVGPQGPKGEKGEKGEKGDQGMAGPVGPKGEQGPQGPQGLKGDKGDTGSLGPVGPRGPEGPRGLPGPAGIAAIHYEAYINYQNSSNRGSLVGEMISVPSGFDFLDVPTPVGNGHAMLRVDSSGSLAPAPGDEVVGTVRLIFSGRITSTVSDGVIFAIDERVYGNRSCHSSEAFGPEVIGVTRPDFSHAEKTSSGVFVTTSNGRPKTGGVAYFYNQVCSEDGSGCILECMEFTGTYYGLVTARVILPDAVEITPTDDGNGQQSQELTLILKR